MGTLFRLPQSRGQKALTTVPSLPWPFQALSRTLKGLKEAFQPFASGWKGPWTEAAGSPCETRSSLVKR